MIASMSEGLVSLAVDQFIPQVLPRTSYAVPTLGEWELVAQVPLPAGTVNLRNADARLRVDGQALSETQMSVIDTLCEYTAQATKIQR